MDLLLELLLEPLLELLLVLLLYVPDHVLLEMKSTEPARQG